MIVYFLITTRFGLNSGALSHKFSDVVRHGMCV